MITEFKMPKMGESITEATIISWLKNVGDFVNAEETIVEVATDKVDNDVPSPVSGVITEIRFQKDDVVEVGTVLALINSDGVQETKSQKHDVAEKSTVTPSKVEVKQPKTDKRQPTTNNGQPTTDNFFNLTSTITKNGWCTKYCFSRFHCAKRCRKTRLYWMFLCDNRFWC